MLPVPHLEGEEIRLDVVEDGLQRGHVAERCVDQFKDLGIAERLRKVLELLALEHLAQGFKPKFVVPLPRLDL